MWYLFKVRRTFMYIVCIYTYIYINRIGALRHEEKCRRVWSAGDRGRSTEFARERRTKQHHGRFVPGRPLRPSRPLHHRKFRSHYVSTNIISFLNFVVFTLSLTSSFFFMLVCKEEEFWTRFYESCLQHPRHRSSLKFVKGVVRVVSKRAFW